MSQARGCLCGCAVVSRVAEHIPRNCCVQGRAEEDGSAQSVIMDVPEGAVGMQGFKHCHLAYNSLFRGYFVNPLEHNLCRLQVKGEAPLVPLPLPLL